MKPIKFKEANKTLIGESPVIKDLPVFTKGKECLSYWKMNFLDRLKALIWGKVWLCVLTPKGTQPPIWLRCEKNVMEKRR